MTNEMNFLTSISEYVNHTIDNNNLSIEEISKLVNIDSSSIKSINAEIILDLSTKDFLRLLFALEIDLYEMFLSISKQVTIANEETRYKFNECFVASNEEFLEEAGLSYEILNHGIKYTYELLDTIDYVIRKANGSRLSEEVELANLSTIIGNFLGTGIAASSKGVFQRNGPHKYPDLLACEAYARDIEIKMALEKNKPKGHLPKEGYYLTCRYVLADEFGNYRQGRENRGTVVWIWEIRFGYLLESHFNSSNTEGDSGKTAVINSQGMNELKVVYFDKNRLPFKSYSKIKEYQNLHR